MSASELERLKLILNIFSEKPGLNERNLSEAKASKIYDYKGLGKF